ncbi:hypothetical protein FE257_001136 [Aspergillus nanangensis]|uniref:Lanthionine synthetase C family protein n=1 Tax=Aspergillus nanangensis TaxID=2582783 RepID=A0AAD4CU31_ASPNN|nr:hypothetical protein FE257_001136 [Aspergillus nanangensis]
MSHPQYYQNTLEPVPIDKIHLESALNQLQVAVHRGADLVQHGVPPPTEWDIAGVYYGITGVALAFLRLAHQATALTDENTPLSMGFHQLAKDRILPHGPDLPVRADRLSPSGSPTPLAGVVPRILEAGAVGGTISSDDVKVLRETVNLALQNAHLVPHGEHMMGADEPLYGRAGLLLTLVNIRAHSFDQEAQAWLDPIFDSIPLLVDAIITSGREGHRHYIQRHDAKDAPPLMWSWMEGYYGLGAVHGMCGILAALLACRPEEVNDSPARNYLPWIAGTISALCKICVDNNGHLPMSIPSRPASSNRESPLVQMCHGSPGILLLMADVMRNKYLIADYWEPRWEDAIRLSSDRIWEQGLLSKGGGLCHGITGNAWPLLYAHDALEYEAEAIQSAKSKYMKRSQTNGGEITGLTSDILLSRGLALMLHARETPPYRASPKSTSNIYRMPDRPFGLTEGLSGTICAWAETCIVIQSRLRKMELDDKRPFQDDAAFQKLQHLMLGFPSVAYHRPTGMF